MTTKTPWKELEVLLDRDGMTQAQLAARTGLSVSYVNDLIRGRRQVNGRTRRLIAETLRVPQSMLIPHTEDPEQ